MAAGDKEKASLKELLDEQKETAAMAHVEAKDQAGLVREDNLREKLKWMEDSKAEVEKVREGKNLELQALRDELSA